MKRLADRISSTHKLSYNEAIVWLRTRLSFALLCSSLMCIRGSRPHRSRRVDMNAVPVAISETGLEKSGRIVAFCDWNARFCDQKTWCSRNFAPKTRRPGASLRPDEHSSRPDSENRNQKRPSNSDERERREPRQFSCLCLQLGVDRKLSTCAAICRLCCVAPDHLRLALPDPSIGRRSYMS